MKKLVFIPFALAVGIFSSCDRVTDPYKPAIEIDTNLYPGNWEDYTYPTFTQNTNADRNVMLEDFTGHKCPSCPSGAAVAKDIENANSRVFVATIHAGKGGLTNFQKISNDCGTITNPNDEFCTILYVPEGLEYGATFQNGYGFFGNPSGTINRVSFDGDANNMFLGYPEWTGRVNEVLTANDLKLNIQAQSNYYTETNGLYLHVETEFLEDLSGNDYNLVVYVLENEIVDFQDSSGVILEDYHHHNVFRGCIDGLAWGRSIAGNHTANEKTYYDYSYELPAGKTNADYHLLIYAYDVATYEVLQVIKHEF